MVVTGRCRGATDLPSMRPQRVEQVRTVAVERAEQRASDAIEPKLRLLHELQMQVGRRRIVFPLQRIQQALGSTLNFVPPTASKSSTSTR